MYIRNICTILLSFLLCQSITAQTEKEDSLHINPPEIGIQKITKKPAHLADFAHGVKKAYKVSAKGLKAVGHELNDVDTLYISPNKYNFAFMLEQSTWFEHYRLGGGRGSSNQSINFAPNANAKIGIYFGWRWIFLGVSFDIKDILGIDKSPYEKRRKEVAFNLYSSKFGVDLYSRRTGSDFKITS